MNDRWTLPPARNMVAVAAGGMLGAAGRYELSLSFAPSPNGLPLVTLAENVTGAFLLGVVLTLVLERWPPTRYVRPFFCTGVLGGYTTFSTLSVEVVVLGKDGRAGVAALYVMSSLVGGLAAAALGIVVARMGAERKVKA